MAVCLAGQTRELSRPSTLQLFARHFWKTDYRLFLAVEATASPNLLQRVQAVLRVNASGIAARDVPRQRVEPCSPRIYGFGKNLREERLLPMARRIEECANLIQAARRRGERFDVVVRSRPDFRFTQPVRHVRDLLAAKAGAVGLMWDDQLMIARAREGLGLLRQALHLRSSTQPEQGKVKQS